jgi:type I restriction enzyme S subunit
MKSEKILDSEEKITGLAVQEAVAKMIPAQSLLFVVRSGILRRILPIGLTAIEVTVNQDLKALTTSSFVDPEYMLTSALGLREEIRNNCQKDGTTVESIEVPALQIYPIPLPPFDEQRQIVAEATRKLTVMDAIEKQVISSLLRAEHLRQSILSKAFSGKLINGDPADFKRNDSLAAKTLQETIG